MSKSLIVLFASILIIIICINDYFYSTKKENDLYELQYRVLIKLEKALEDGRYCPGNNNKL